MVHIKKHQKKKRVRNEVTDPPLSRLHQQTASSQNPQVFAQAVARSQYLVCPVVIRG